MGSNVLIKEYMVDFLFQELWMSELACQIAIIGEQKHTSGVAVEASYRVNALTTSVLDKFHNRFALLRVIACCNAVLWLVEEHVNLLLYLYWVIVEFHLVGSKHFRTEFGHYIAIYAYHTCLYELIGFASATNACVGKEFVQANRFIWIIVFLFVLDTFLQTVFCVRVVVGGMLTVATLTIVVAATLVAVVVTIALLLTIAATIVVTATLLTVTTAAAITAA